MLPVQFPDILNIFLNLTFLIFQLLQSNLQFLYFVLFVRFIVKVYQLFLPYLFYQTLVVYFGLL